MSSAKEEFIELVTNNSRINGLDEVSSIAIGILYVEPKEIALDELSERTGYSLSAVSTSMKMLENFGLIKRVKKPGSKKVYFYMDKDMVQTTIQLMRKKLEKVIRPSLEKIPEIIKHYKKENSKKSKEELTNLENYYMQIKQAEILMEQMLQMDCGK